MSEWKRVVTSSVAMLPREGWKGAWDALVSAITGYPRYTEETTINVSVYVRNPNNIEYKLDLWGTQIETGKKEEQ